MRGNSGPPGMGYIISIPPPWTLPSHPKEKKEKNLFFFCFFYLVIYFQIFTYILFFILYYHSLICFVLAAVGVVWHNEERSVVQGRGHMKRE